MFGGYKGKYAVVDLGSSSVELVEPGDDFYRKYLSGYGLGAAVIAQRQKAGVHPLSPENHLGFCSGLLTGTGVLFSGRYMVVGKSPLTGGWGDANSGGYLSNEIKKCGLDAVFFVGRAEKPTWVHITERGIEFKDASSLWGMDTVETEKVIKNELGDAKARVACIGMGGERRSLISGVVTDGGRIAARSGLGALMGSKNLKAVSFRGDEAVPVARPDEVEKINRRFLKDYKKQAGWFDRFSLRHVAFIGHLFGRMSLSFPAKAVTVREIFRNGGTPGLTVYSAFVGDMPIRNWNGVGYSDYSPENIVKVSGENVLKYQKRKYACQSCPLACGGLVDIKKGRYAGNEGHKPEYESIGAFGGLLLNSDLDSIMELNEMCNRAGIDTISAGGAVAFAIECFENGLIDRNTTSGLTLRWGDAEAIIKLTEQIITRQGLGDLLADGVRVASQKIGKGSEKFAVHAGGQELPMHDSRFDHGYAIAYQCEPTPGRHTISNFLYPGLFSVEKKFPEARRMARSAGNKAARNIKLYAATSYYTNLANGCGLCIFGIETSDYPIVEYLNAVTGWDLSADDYLTAGRRLLALRKAFNVREGVTRDDTKLHPRGSGHPPMDRGPLKGVTVDIDTLEREFFESEGWDMTLAGPGPELLKEMGIDGLFEAPRSR